MTRVLVVDDDEDFLFIIGEYLTMSGIECHTAQNAFQAGKRFLDCDYDLVISDLQMPGESGLDLFHFLSSRSPKLPFILMSGNTNPAIRRQALKSGVSRFLEKPFELSALKRIITNQALGLTQADRGRSAAIRPRSNAGRGKTWTSCPCIKEGSL